MDQERDKLSEDLKSGTDEILNRSKALREKSADTAKHLKEVVDEGQEFLHPNEKPTQKEVPRDKNNS